MLDSLPYFGGILASYFVRVTVAYAVFWLLSRLSPSPRRRFALWLLFLLGAAGYWAVTLVPTPLRVTVGTAAHNAGLAPYTVLIPASWAPALTAVAPAIAAAYLLGISLLLASMLWQHLGLWRALRQAQEPSRDLALLFEQMRRGFGLRRCRLQILPQLNSPATAGWLRPRILLPAICEEFSDGSQLADVLYHELMHVARRDYLWAAVSDLVRCLLFFHPAVWRARQHMRLQRELACDVAVVSGRPEHRADYAQCLTRFARLRMQQSGGSVGIDFAASASLLGMRVRAVLSHRPQLSWWRNGLRLAVSLALLACFGLLWPAFGIVADFAVAPQLARVVAPPPAVVRTPVPHVHSPRRLRAPAREEALIPPLFAYPSPRPVLLSPPTSQPQAPVIMAMARSDFGPQSDTLDPGAPSPVSDGTAPNWGETRPLSHARARLVNVVQRVATELAQIGRGQLERAGRDRGGH
jgi:beta-lactamase regulating signal transducer with metallopeptidase domain